jgi:hypothetical protein
LVLHSDTLYGGDYAWAIGKDLVTKDEAALIAAFHKLLEQYEAPCGDDYDNERILGDPAWLDIVGAARQTVGCLLKKLDDPSERSILLAR